MLDTVTTIVGTVAGDSGKFPPDSMGAIGRKGQFVELINTGYSLYDNGTLAGRITLEGFWDNAFFNTYNNPDPTGVPPPLVQSSEDVFDPRILFDANTQRWYAVSVSDGNSTNSNVYVGVTTSHDPSLENWRGFVMPADSDNQHWADFPTLGYSDTGLFIGTEMFPIDGTGAQNEVHLHGIPLASLTAAVPSVAGRRRVEDIGFTDAFQPAVDLGGLSKYNVPYLGFSTDAGSLRMMEIPDDFFSTGNLGPAMDVLAFPGFVHPVDAPYDSSLGITTPIDAGRAELSSNVVLSYTGYWGVLNVNNVLDGNNGLQTFNIHAVTNQLIRSDAIQQDHFHYLYPSIAVGPYGEVVVGFNYSFIPPGEDGAFFAPSAIAVAGGYDSNGNFSFGIPDLLESSNATFQRLVDGDNRWGDYSATTVAFNGHDFFTIQEEAYAPNAWATSISQLNVTGVDAFNFNLGAGSGPGSYTMAVAQPLDGGLTIQRIRMSGEFGGFNLPEELIAVGDMATETYRLRFDAVLDTGDRLPRVLTDLEALVTQKYTLSEIDGDLRLFDTELLMFEATLPEMFLTLDDLLPSLGQLLLVETAEGTIVKSYIDLMPMLLVDGDADGSFEHSFRSIAPGRLFLRGEPVPEPATIALCLLALAALRLRRAPRARRQ